MFKHLCCPDAYYVSPPRLNLAIFSHLGVSQTYVRPLMFARRVARLVARNEFLSQEPKQAFSPANQTSTRMRYLPVQPLCHKAARANTGIIVLTLA